MHKVNVVNSFPDPINKHKCIPISALIYVHLPNREKSYALSKSELVVFIT